MKVFNKPVTFIAWLTIAWAVISAVISISGVMFFPWYVVFGPALIMLLCTFVAILILPKL